MKVVAFKNIPCVSWQCLKCGDIIVQRKELDKRERSEARCYTSSCYALYQVNWGNSQDEIQVTLKEKEDNDE